MSEKSEEQAATMPPAAYVNRFHTVAFANEAVIRLAFGEELPAQPAIYRSAVLMSEDNTRRLHELLGQTLIEFAKLREQNRNIN